jgi:outer membrane protein OmpA-like peptidoglycan-associated protein
VAATRLLAVFYGNDAVDGALDEALMDRGGMASSPPRLLVMRTIPFVAALVLFAAAATPAAAQTVVGGIEPPEVTVDLSVLESLGPPPTLPDLLRGQLPTGRGTLATRPAAAKRLGLHPPKTKKKATAEAAHKREKPEVAARPAAPIAPVAVTGGAVPRESVAATPLTEAPPAPPAATPAPTTPAPAEPTPPAAAAAPAKPAAPATPIAPVAAPPSPVPEASPPSPATVAAMNMPPTLPPEGPVKPTPAAAPAALAAATGEHTRIVFAGTAAELPDDAKSGLDALAQRMAGDDHLRLQLVAYAAGSPDQANQARRISLQRALAVRSYLMEHGIANTRMDVRALGNHIEGSDPADRVDIVMLEH